MAPDCALLFLICLIVKHTLANTAKFSIVRQKSIANTESYLWDGLVLSKIACSIQCLKDFQCLLGHYHPVSKRCALYSSDTLVSNLEEEGVVLIIEGRKKVVDDCGATSETGVVNIKGVGPVFCENNKHGGGWTVFQRRFDGSVDFYRNWENYTLGFGDMNGEFWLGLEKLHKLTSAGDYLLRVDLEDFDKNTAHANYSCLKIGNKSTAYELDIDGYSGNAGDSMGTHNGMKFSTLDRDNDESECCSCAEINKGGWWYNECGRSNLNGPYLVSERGMIWYDWRGWNTLKASKMMIHRL